MKTLIISPTYNERKNITALVQAVFTTSQDYHLLIVDDNSPDGTAEKVRQLQRAYPNLHLEVRQEKNGLGTAYCHGFKWALERDFEAIAQMDADLSHNPEEIPAMVKMLQTHDLVIGSRYCDGISVVHWPLSRLILSYGANIYARIVTGMPIKDGTAGFKVWRRSALETLGLEKVKSQGYSFQIEMHFRAWQKKFRIAEHPIIFIDRTIGESKMSRHIMIEAVIMVLRLRVWRILRLAR
ncbi:MAG: polyprenol monophosphomannose synthase [FCB group bacterium]|nr:polyprenol monophosphomannose synthase [FCB group bacterium]